MSKSLILSMICTKVQNVEHICTEKQNKPQIEMSGQQYNKLKIMYCSFHLPKCYYLVQNLPPLKCCFIGVFGWLSRLNV